MKDEYHILVVDDNEINRSLVKSILQPLNFIIHEAVDGKDGVEQYKKVTPDLTLMDIRMPEMDGYEASKHIREYDDNALIVALTASIMASDMEKLPRYGIKDYLLKPINKNMLLDKVKFQLDLEYTYSHR